MDGDANVTYTLIRDLPATERPRERLRDAGADHLSVPELLAILLRTGTAKESALSQATRLLARFKSLEGLRNAPFQELCNEHGIGEAKAAQIKAALELGIRATRQDGRDPRPIVRSPDDIAALVLHEMSALEQEQVRVVLLDVRNRVLGLPTVYVGSVHTTNVRIGELLADALRVKAAAIVLLHNHPSGDPAPSAADVQMTKQLAEAAQLMDMELLDHIVIAGGRFASMKQLRTGFA